MPHIHAREYKEWRMTGIAFETRLTAGMTPNRTLSSFVAGKKKKSGDFIMVRGFWGDIVNSPFVPLGSEVENLNDK
jgi:dynein assembly factor 3